MWTAETRALVGDFGAGQALSDEQYALPEPLIPPARPGGRPRTTEMRRLLDGLSYLVRTGCRWRHLPPPPAFPPRRTVYGYMRAFADAGVWEGIRHHLVAMLRERDGREPSPSAAIVRAGRQRSSRGPRSGRSSAAREGSLPAPRPGRGRITRAPEASPPAPCRGPGGRRMRGPA